MSILLQRLHDRLDFRLLDGNVACDQLRPRARIHVFAANGSKLGISNTDDNNMKEQLIHHDSAEDGALDDECDEG